MKGMNRVQSGGGKTRWYTRAMCVFLCVAMALALTLIPTSGNKVSAYDLKRYVTLQLEQVYPEIDVVAKAYVVGSDNILQKGSKIQVQKVAAGTKIQGKTIDPKYMPQDNMENLQQAASGVVTGNPLRYPNCAYIEREGAVLRVVYYDEEKVIFWSAGYRSFSDLSPWICKQDVYLESNSPGFYQVPRNIVWLDPGRTEKYNAIPASEKNKQPVATGTVGGSALAVRIFPQTEKKYGAAYALTANSKVDVMSTQVVPAIDGSSDTFYKIRFNQPSGNDSSYMKYKADGYYYVNSKYVDLNIKGKTAPAATAVGRTQNVNDGNYAYVRSSPKNENDNVVGRVVNNVEVTQIPSMDTTDSTGKKWKALWYSGKVAYMPENLVADGPKIVVPNMVQNLRIKEVKNNQYVLAWDEVPTKINYRVVVANNIHPKRTGTDWVVWKTANQQENTFTVKKEWFKKADKDGNLFILVDAITPKKTLKTTYITLTKFPEKPEKIQPWQIVEEGKGKLTFIYMSSLQYSTNKKFKSAKTINSNESVIESVKGFKKGKTYYFRYRTYKTVQTDAGTTKVYSPWSAAFKKKITWKSDYDF